MVENVNSGGNLAQTRNASVDYLRFVGALGIVLFHMNLPGAWIGLAALPMFVLLIVLYGLERPVAAHAKRLLLPWVIWSVVYGLGKLAQAVMQDQPLGTEFALWMLMTGTSLHLWFLPFVFLFMVFAGGVLRQTALPVVWVLASAGSLAALWACNTMILPTPMPQWCATLPAALAGAVLARQRQFMPALVALGGGAALLILLGWEQATWQLMIAAAAVLLVLARPMAATRLSTWAADVSFGIYLIHPLIYAVALHVLPRYSWELYALVVVGSILSTMLLRHFAPRSV